MGSKFNRRKFLAGTAAVASTAAFPMPSIAQSAPVKIGLLTVKTGPLASGGIQMEQGIVTFLQQKNYMLAGRKVDFISTDTGGNPAGAKTKAQELVEKDKVDVIMGPLAAFEMLAITDYIAQAKIPLMSLAGAEDMTQRKPNPYFIRASATSSQCMKPMADYATKVLGYKTAITISEDFAFGYEQMGGFQQVFEANGGKVLNKLWPPLVTADYTPYLAQIPKCDVVCQGFAGSNPVRFMKQYYDAGLTIPVCGGETAGDDALLKSFVDGAAGMYNACPYTIDLDTPMNKRFIADIVKLADNVPGFYAAGLYTNGQVVEAALEKLGGATSDKAALIKALRSVVLADTPRGPVKFDHFGNVIGNVYVRQIVKDASGKLSSKTLKTYTNIDQFWPYDEKTFLAQPVYSRDFPPLKS
jgi:branched-chain amino acid transport system substrate-binding protein